MSDELEKRAHKRLQGYWDSLRRNRIFPSESEFDPDDIPDIWPSCFLISIDAVTQRIGYRYSYLGADLIKAYGYDNGDIDVHLHLLSTTDTAMVKKFDEVRDRKKLIIDESEFVNLKNIRIKYRTCLVPLGYDESKVSHIIGCMRWKIC